MMKDLTHNRPRDLTPNPALGPTPTLPSREGERPLYYTANYGKYEDLKMNARKMRINPTEAEKALWLILKNKFKDARFRRQHVIDNFIVDFVSLSKFLIIEADGEVHEDNVLRDAERDNTLIMSTGFKILRFKNKEILSETETIIRKIRENLS